MSALLFASFAQATGVDATRVECIRKLASENYAERVEATRVLWAEGALAADALRTAARSKDPEMALRARDLLRKIDLGIEPDTDPRILTLAERYQSANQTEKNTIFHELRRLRAWRQILRLYATETDRSIRENLERMVDGIALHAARERIVKGDHDGALEYLEMARNSSGGMISIAAFHRAQGTLQEEIAAVGEPTTPEDFAWLTTLHRAGNDARSAAQTARAAGDEHLAAAMDMVLGDPLPWLNFAASSAEQRDEMAIARYARAAAARWLGEMSIPETDAIRRQLRSPDESTRQASMAHLFLLGDADAAWKYFAHHYPNEAFMSFDSMERIDDAFTVFDLDPKAPDFESHYASLFVRICQAPGKELDEDESRDESIARFILITNFLEKRGKHDLLDKLVKPRLLEFAVIHVPRFKDLMSELFGMPTSRAAAPELASRIATVWAGDDKARWYEMVIAAFGEEQGYAQWWELLEKIDPQATHGERFAGMLALFGFIRDPDGLYDHWLEQVWKHIEITKDLTAALQSAKFLASNVTDLEFMEKLSKVHAEDADVDESDAAFGNLLVDTALGRWADVAEIFLKQIAALAERGEARAELHAYAASCFRKAGRIDEADAHESWVEALALGDSRTNVSIAQAFAFGRDYERATRWYRRAVMEADLGDNRFNQALSGYLSELLERRQFDLIASCSEVLAQLYSAETSFGIVPSLLTRLRQQSDFARALAMPADQSGDAQSMLRATHAMMPTDGGLADHFFPSLLESPFRDLHDELFEISWGKITASLAEFPDADNTMNTAVWFASRSARRLEEAKILQQRALELFPRSPAYLDTLGEIYFAMGNRAEAVRLGELAIRYMPHDSMIVRQHERFKNDDFPMR